MENLAATWEWLSTSPLLALTLCFASTAQQEVQGTTGHIVINLNAQRPIARHYRRMRMAISVVTPPRQQHRMRRHGLQKSHGRGAATTVMRNL